MDIEEVAFFIGIINCFSIRYKGFPSPIQRVSCENATKFLENGISVMGFYNTNFFCKVSQLIVLNLKSDFVCLS